MILALLRSKAFWVASTLLLAIGLGWYLFGGRFGDVRRGISEAERRIEDVLKDRDDAVKQLEESQEAIRGMSKRIADLKKSADVAEGRAGEAERRAASREAALRDLLQAQRDVESRRSTQPPPKTLKEVVEALRALGYTVKE